MDTKWLYFHSKSYWQAKEQNRTEFI